MGAASFVQSKFIGGEWSQAAQGDIADPKYKVAMNVCINGYPTAMGSWIRRSGTQFLGTTRSGLQARLVEFDFETSSPYMIEFTANYMRFWAGPTLATTNDAVAITAISSATPAVVELSSAMPASWASGQAFKFADLGANNPLLQNRVFVGTKIDSTHLSIADAVSATAIDGSALGTFVSGSLQRVQELASPYIGTDWSAVRKVQTETSAIFLHANHAPQHLSVTTLPTSAVHAQFALDPLTFLDGPYLDPVTNGAQLSAASASGIVSLTITFDAWSSTTAYKKDDFVVFSSVVYKALQDNNVNKQPSKNPTYWVAADGGTAIPGGCGFQSTDLGRLIRLYAEPPLYTPGTYSTLQQVTYLNENGTPSYWQCITNGVTVAPGVDATKWGIDTQAATWSWGRIVGFLNMLSGTLSGSSNIGSLTGNGGLAAAFDGVVGKPAASAATSLTRAGGIPSGGGITLSGFIGKNYSGTAAGAYAISQATLYPPSDRGIVTGWTSGAGGLQQATITINLRGKTIAPGSASDGTLLGSYQFVGTVAGPGPGVDQSYVTAPLTIFPNDTTTAWKYVWFEIQATLFNQSNDVATVTITEYAAQAQFFSPSSGGATGVSVELLGGALPYTTIRTWRLGLFSGANWPTCGTWHEGRLWLAGSVGNRIDGSVPNSLNTVDKTISFAPTTRNGVVTDASAISYTFNAPDVNPIYWMEPDQQGILCGTQPREWLVQATTQNPTLTPTNIKASPVTRIGCANIVPRRADHTLLFVQKHRRKVQEYFADIFSGKFSSPDLNEKAKHLTVSGIAEIAYQQELTSILWARRVDGLLIGMTYKRDTLMSSQGPGIVAWHKHPLGSGRTVESICVGASDSGNLDALSMITNDAATSVRHVEMLTDQWEEGDTLPDAWYLDNAVAPSSHSVVAATVGGAPGLQLNGLWHLNGKTVSAFIGGLDCGDWTVSNGSLLVPFAPSTSQGNALFTAAFVSGYSGTLPIAVGFVYNSDGQLLRPDTQPESGARNGPGFGKERRVQRFATRLVDTQGIYFGTKFSRLNKARLRTTGQTPIADNALFNGIHEDPIDDDGEGFASQICWRIRRMFPATVAAIGGFLHTEDK